MYEPLEQLIDRSRQRQFTDDEISGIASHARRLAVGCDVVDRLRLIETRLVQSAVSNTQQKFPDCESTAPGAIAMLEQSLLLMLRQCAFGMAVDDHSRLCEFLCDLQTAYWTSGITGGMAEYATAMLRDDVSEALEPAAAKAFDPWLQIGSRFLIASAEVGSHRTQIVDAAVTAVFTAYPDLETRYPDCRRKTEQDFERVLMHSIRGALPDGHERLFRMLRTFHDAIMQSKFGAAFMEEAYELLMEACRQHLAPGRSLELFAQLRCVMDFMTLSADLSDHMDAIVNTSTEGLLQQHPERQVWAEYIEKIKRDEQCILECCAFATLPGGQRDLIDKMSSFNGTLIQSNFGGRFIADAYQILLETCRTTLRARSRATLMPVLHRAANFLAIASDLAERREVMLGSLVDRLETRHSRYFSTDRDAKFHVARDQELLLFNLALSLLPGADEYTAGRFATFGETVLQGRFDKALMLESFEMLEAACMESLDAQSLALLMPRWRKVRQYLEACVELSTCETDMVSEAVSAVTSKFAADLSQFENGEVKTARDLRTLLRTTALSIIPGGEQHLVRGMTQFMDNIAATHMPKAMLDLSFSKLTASARKTLPVAQQQWLVPRLEQCQSFIHIAADMGEQLGPIVDASIAAAFKRHTDKEQQYPGARRKAAEDFEKTLRRSAVALLPGGGAELSNALWDFSLSMGANQFGAAFFADAYGQLLKQSKSHLDRVSKKPFESPLSGTIHAITLLAELAEHDTKILETCVDALYKKYPEPLKKMRSCREKTIHDMRCILNCCALAVAPGGERWLATHLELFSEVLIDGHFGAQFMWDAYSGLVRQVKKQLRHPAKATLMTNLESARDYIALMAGIVDKQDTILSESLKALLKKHDDKMRQYPNVEEKTAHDQRLILRSCALALLPGGQVQHEEIVELMQTVSQRLNFDRVLLLDGYKLLGKSCKKHLQLGPVRELTRTLSKSVQKIAA